MSTPVIILGEASETDSDDEIILKNIIQGEVINGEDSESEIEDDKSVVSAISTLDDPSLHSKGKTGNFESLFHQKLRENNIKLRDDIDLFSHNTIQEASKSLNTTEQHLLKSQLTLQNAVTSLKSLSVNSLSIKSKLHSILTNKFLSNVDSDKILK